MRARAAEGTATCDRLGEHPVDLCAVDAAIADDVLGVEGRGVVAVAELARRDADRAGIRVVNVFPGPIDDEWNQLVPPPKLAPAALAKAVVKALKDGVEDIYPGDVAQDLLARLRESAKVARARDVGQ